MKSIFRVRKWKATKITPITETRTMGQEIRTEKGWKLRACGESVKAGQKKAARRDRAAFKEIL
ncbi:hypothetical protein N9932_00120 [bacterium]|nr:hypothetical protein [Akkermansiaceae bacterium]MDB4318479.1 hypothetical protein [bacterium]MDB4532238.1 hypothetical protein [bacterium]MDB4817307.1 hypothetical protein [Akkermansiaceae bacterium]